jgi:hypothetical protein
MQVRNGSLEGTEQGIDGGIGGTLEEGTEGKR